MLQQYNYITGLKSSIMACGRNTWSVMPSVAGRLRNSAYTISLSFANGKPCAFVSSSWKSLPACSPSVHLHSPTRIFFLSKDSATTSNSMFFFSLLMMTVSHQRDALPQVVPSSWLPLTAFRQRRSQCAATKSEKVSLMVLATTSFQFRLISERLGIT